MRNNTIENNFFVENRASLKAHLKPGSAALFFSNYQMPRNGDQYFTYRQNSDFFYLTGIEQEESILLIVPDAPNNKLKEVLFIIRPNKNMEIWTGHKLRPEEATSISGISTIQYLEDFDAMLHSLITDIENLYFNLPELPKFSPAVRSHDEVKAQLIKEKYPLHKFERLAPIMMKLRLKKSDTEIELIKKAGEITRDAFLSVLSEIKPGMMEYETEALLSYEFLKKGASGHAYAPIVASGKNACVLHYIENNCLCRDGDLLLMDFGAEYANYAADISRTIPVNGKFSPRQLDLYNSCLQTFRYAQSLMKPGTTINKLHDEVCKFWVEEHIKLGLYSAEDATKIIDGNPPWFQYYMHGTSHFLGLDVHDVGTKDIVLESGMVLTCEPAIYIAEEGIGIRIENDILITEAGFEDLNSTIPIEPGDIENLMHA